MLVPFLVFAIGVSHGAQKMNGIMQDIGRGTTSWWRRATPSAACSCRPDRAAGRRGRLRGADGDRHPGDPDLALTASIGVAVLIFTNLMLLPVLLSYVGVSARPPRAACAPSRPRRQGRKPSAVGLAGPLHRAPLGHGACGRRRGAGGRRLHGQPQLKIGDLDPGAPELRADSRYNRDNAYITATTRCPATSSR
jgi:hypothetical protein